MGYKNTKGRYYYRYIIYYYYQVHYMLTVICQKKKLKILRIPCKMIVFLCCCCCCCCCCYCCFQVLTYSHWSFVLVKLNNWLYSNYVNSNVKCSRCDPKVATNVQKGNILMMVLLGQT